MAGPCGDHGHLLPGALAPVRVGAERVPELLQAAAGRFGRAGRELCLGGRVLELVQGRARRLEVALGERPLDAVDRRQQPRLLVERGAEVQVDVGRRRPVHPGDLHVAAERDHPEPVLDAVVHPLHQRRREADVEAPRPHPDGERGEEVPGLVDQDQERKPGDGDGDGHAGTPRSASRRASASASTRSSRSRAGAPSTSASASSTAAAMPRNGRRPSRNAATATSLAALNAHG